ncbi:spermine synthase [Kluyveromyces lactis]|uniref:KLLA0D17094p n=1 Tax=Kluyveromyces lactis (strain ATCC 8585 / CBS 2359 / DSM 70799 / NBRC 1267 / NRRL Y-1140 / WM37) TaxID=284590 RepID=Q6CQH3_KLULA|nr:uncharacterized protein KLLA0_D17094g [Kluyveromyces lactis]CAH00912.1 KLLA0D17094p [Kluyveromyces lactis]|eukprot:XP_453816.1 uncharacterized protein KLLA0_D17094g [Kluyveromyces lactis]
MSSKHPCIKDGWFNEVSDKSFPGQAFSLKVNKILFHEKTQFQDILIFESSNYGNVLVLDGIIQVSEKDEFAYQELISHVPLYSHENPKKILVIGGGDGGVLREVVKHSCVEEATLVEIDAKVIELSKKYLPNMACSFKHPKVNVKLCDGFQFLRDVAESGTKYDVIITDSSDPEGPAEAFFQKEYFELLYKALTENGVVIAQASENVWLNLEYLKTLLNTSRSVFPVAEYCYTMLPTYTSGQLGLIACCKNPNTNLIDPCRAPTEDEQSQMRYYNNKMHSAAFVLPTWARKVLNPL